MSTGRTSGTTATRPEFDRPPGASERKFAVAAFVAYVIVVAGLAALHEPWFDELQAWRIAIDSDTLTELVHNRRYEGHPILWFLVLRTVGLVSRQWHAVVAIHVAIASATAWLVLRHAPLPRLVRLLILAGYFFAYEYTAVVRGYGLGVLLAFGACVAWSATPRRTWTTIVCLVLLANTSALGLVLAIAFVPAVLLDSLIADGAGWWRRREAWYRTGVVASASLVGVLAVAVQLRPPPEAPFKSAGITDTTAPLWLAGRTLTLPARAFAPIPSSSADGVVWGGWAFEPSSRIETLVAIAAALLVVLLTIHVLWRHHVALLLWLTALTGLMLFFGLFYFGGIRHYGYIVIAFVCALWLAAGRSSSGEWRSGTALTRSQWVALVLLLAPMPIATVQVAAGDLSGEFSDARAVAALLRQPRFSAMPLVGLARPWSQSVAALLDRPVHFPAERRASTWVNLGQERDTRSMDEKTDRVVRELGGDSRCDIIVLASDEHVPSAWLLARSHLLYRNARRPMSGHRITVWQVRLEEGECHPGGQ